MEISNLPQYNTAWGDCDNKEMLVTCYMAMIVWYFLKKEMCGSALNITTVADCFKVNRSQLSDLIMAKKFKSGLGGYILKKKKMAEVDPSRVVAKPGNSRSR